MSEHNQVCQSCGMPLLSPSDRGTEKDNSPSNLYCQYCYQQGAFTEPDITLSQMAERSASIISQMYEMPVDKAQEFTYAQVRNLYRWSGAMIPSCESCGMPLITDQDAGTERDGSPSQKYCTHCYQQGSFTDPDLTRDQMIKKYAPLLSQQFGVSVAKAEEMVRVFSATLPRWKD